MLHEFLNSHREELIIRCRAKVNKRSAPRATEKELEHGIPVLVGQLAYILRAESLGTDVEGPGWEATLSATGIGDSATSHGNDLLVQGFTVGQVVHDYGDLCQAITELAIERNAPISNTEFRTLNRCLDNAIAAAVSEFARDRDNVTPDDVTTDGSAHLANASLDFFTRGLTLVNSAMHAVDAIKHGHVGMSGSTGRLLDWTLKSLQDLTVGALVDVRLKAGIPEVRHRVLVSEVIEEHRISAAIDAKARGLQLLIADVEPGLAIQVDRQILGVAVTNLLQNAFKLTKSPGRISMKAFSSADRVLIEIEDECGGLPQGNPKDLLRTFEERSSGRSGLGLGLSVSHRAAEANGGKLHVRDVPGKGCVFTIDLPKADPADGKKVAAD